MRRSWSKFCFLAGMSLFALSIEAKTRAFNVENQIAFTYPGSLPNIKKHKRLRVLTTANSFNYFVDGGQQKGFEYEIAAAFVKHLNQKFSLKKDNEKPIFLEVIPVDRDELIPMLQEGRGDLIAAGLTQTKKRKSQLAFSIAYNRVSEVIVSHPSQGKLTTFSDLAGKRIAVRRSSSYYNSLQKLNRSFRADGREPISIQTVDEQLETDTILELVSLNRFPISVADSHIAAMAAESFENLRVHTDLKVREDAEISWAVRPDAGQLLQHINQFLPRFKKGSFRGNLNLKRYFANIDRLGAAIRPDGSKQISKYDPYFKTFGRKYGWDWTLLAALAYQESRFRQNIRNRWGAIGLLQVKELVAKEPYINVHPIAGAKNAKNNVHAGTKYLDWIYETYFQDVAEMTADDRIKLTLAAYNAGPGRLRRARQLASKMHLNPNRWNRNVEYALLAMHRLEPVKYVSEIRQRYIAYQLLGFD